MFLGVSGKYFVDCIVTDMGARSDLPVDSVNIVHKSDVP